MNLTLSITGNKEIDDVLKGLPDKFNHKTLQAAHAEAAKPLVAKEHLLAPVGKTGKTADSIGIVKIPFSKASVIGEIQVGPRRGRFGGSKAHLNEFGTVSRNFRGANRGAMKAKPFAEPAFNQTKDEMLERISLALAQKAVVFMKKTIKQHG